MRRRLDSPATMQFGKLPSPGRPDDDWRGPIEDCPRVLRMSALPPTTAGRASAGLLRVAGQSHRRVPYRVAAAEQRHSRPSIGMNCEFLVDEKSLPRNTKS